MLDGYSSGLLMAPTTTATTVLATWSARCRPPMAGVRAAIRLHQGWPVEPADLYKYSCGVIKELAQIHNK
jgi:hypothetical protein